MTVYVAVTGNTYPVREELKALGGRWDAAQRAWMVPEPRLPEAQALLPAPRAPAAIGSLAPIMALFARVAGRQRAAIVLAAPDGLGGSWKLRLTPAKPNSANPGAVYVKCDGTYLGKVASDGAFRGSRDLSTNAERNIVPVLQRFAADPAGVAAAYGHATHHCCFCGLSLTDPRSKSVGYGPICAGNYGLPWGEVAPAVDAAEVDDDGPEYDAERYALDRAERRLWLG